MSYCNVLSSMSLPTDIKVIAMHGNLKIPNMLFLTVVKVALINTLAVQGTAAR